MWRPVISEKVIKCGILISGLRLMQNPAWRSNKEKRELMILGNQISDIMALHMISDELIVGVPLNRVEVKLLEVPRYENDQGFHVLSQISESIEGYFIRIEKIA